jgi:hypothetical protein
MFGNGDCNTNGELSFFNSIKDKCDIIFDVGCRSDTLMLNATCSVHYFDPVETFINELKLQPNINSQSFFNSFGLSNVNSVSEYYSCYQSFHNRSGTGISPQYNDITTPVLLNVKKGCDYIKEQNISKIDFLKIDTEGHEFSVIKGFEDSIKIVKVIQFEYGGCFLDSNVKLFDLVTHLKNNNFSKFSYLADEGLVEITNFEDHYKYCNIVCFNNNI